MKHFLVVMLALLLPLQCAAGLKPLKKLSRDPYVAAFAIDADSQEVLFEEGADTPAWPASVLKLMTLFIVLDAVESGKISLADMVQVTKEAARMGGSQVYLDPNEQFSVEDLLYALMVQSANDAAVALAIHVAGSKTAFVALMNEKAQHLGMKNSHFHSVHGLPPESDQQVDVTTARDLSLLALALVKKPETLRFTSAKEWNFRNGEFVMRNHNHLLGNLPGCDGLKTGFFSAAGYSIVATAMRNGRRVIAIVLDCENRKDRDTKARELIEKGFASLKPLSKEQEAIVQSAQGVGQKNKVEAGSTGSIIPENTTLALDGNSSAEGTAEQGNEKDGGGWIIFAAGLGCGMVLGLLLPLFLSHRRKRSAYSYTR